MDQIVKPRDFHLNLAFRLELGAPGLIYGLLTGILTGLALLLWRFRTVARRGAVRV